YGGSPTFEMDDGYLYTISIGRELIDGLRLEFHLGQSSSDSDSSGVMGMDTRVDDVFNFQAEIESTIFLANLVYDFDYLNWPYTPYLRGGIGATRNTIDAQLSAEFNSDIWLGTPFEGQSVENQPFAEGKSTEFAWNVAAGVKKSISDRATLRLEYGLLSLGNLATGIDANEDAVRFDELQSQQLVLSFDWKFR
ncbi:MAG: outer membrane beta-barrel protein, partial [Proteobacteria bacterium]|nr:outer membrane beta-barrel protein [Pseudomonadota bacterium]